MPGKRKGGYTVGYGKPPKHSQFQKGQSGNRKGRPKGAKNFGTVLDEELSGRVDITENGKPKRISKLEGVAKQLVNKAVTGDPKAIPILLNEIRMRGDLAGSGPAQPQSLGEDDQLVMQSILKRIRE